MELRTFVCLFDLKPYDARVAPALRQYTRQFDPAGIVTLLEQLPGDHKHWIDSIGPDKGYKPSEQTVRELCDIIIPGACLPREANLNPMQDADALLPWLAPRSEWFSDLMDDGEELSGPRLEFGFGTGRLVATRQQIAQFQAEIADLEPPDGPWAGLAPHFRNLRRILSRATDEETYTLFKTNLEKAATSPSAAPE